MKYVFGPVASRRLGTSLGVDLLYNSICSFDCIYCECGKTSAHTLKRAEYVSYNEVISELKFYLDSNEKNIDYVTFSGSGEPTLHTRIGDVIKFIKQYDVKVALLTNSTLLSDPKVRKEIMDIDLVVPTLNTVNQTTLEKINRPCDGINIENIKSGLKLFSEEFKGQIFVEVLLCAGINDSIEEISAIADFLKNVKFTKIQINTVVRPPAYGEARLVSHEKLLEFNSYFQSQGLDSEIIGNPPKIKKSKYDEKEFLRTVEIRPLTRKDISSLFEIKDSDIDKILQSLIKKRIIYREGDFYIKK